MSRSLAALTFALGLMLGILSLIPVSSTAMGPQIGAVSRIENTATALRDGSVIALGTGTTIHRGDHLETGQRSKLEITLVDDTKLTLGAGAQMVVDEFVFEPNSNLATLTVNAIAGPFRFVTGRLGSIANKQVAVATPYASIGIRGTEFWGGPIRGNYGVLLLEGAIDVTNAGVTRVLDASGAGVDITSPDAPPGPIVIWGQGKVDEALATVAFTQ